jgi:hypothetical protein
MRTNLVQRKPYDQIKPAFACGDTRRQRDLSNAGPALADIRDFSAAIHDAI